LGLSIIVFKVFLYPVQKDLERRQHEILVQIVHNLNMIEKHKLNQQLNHHNI